MAASSEAWQASGPGAAGGLAARLSPVVEALVAVAPERRPSDRLPAPVHAALVASGLWKLWVPQVHGGLEQDLPASLALFERAAAVDGSLGFALAIGTGGGLFAAWLPEATAQDIFTPEAALIAGSGAPTGTARPLADDPQGGLVVTGEWRYASLIHSATWVTASVRVADSDAVVAVAVPVGEVEILQRWQADALAGTDSQDLRMSEVRVPSARVFDLTSPPRLAGALYRFDFMALASAAFASVAVGIARGAVQGVRDRLVAQGRIDDEVATRLARATARQRAAWRALQASVSEAWALLATRPSLPPASVLDVRLAAVEATRQAVAAVDELAAIAGMRLLARHDPFSQAWRDVHGVAQHALITVARERELGLGLLEGGAD